LLQRGLRRWLGRRLRGLLRGCGGGLLLGEDSRPSNVHRLELQGNYLSAAGARLVEALQRMLEFGRRVSPEVWRRIAGTLDRQLDHLDLNPCRLYRLDIEDWFLCRLWVSGEDLLLFQDRDDGSELYRIDQRFFSEAVRAVMLQHIEFVVLL
jgi:hypothetical protein